MLTFSSEQCIRALFMDPQISLFSNFFIKNGSHDTIHTFKNYFAIVFSVSATISSIQTDPLYVNPVIINVSFTAFDVKTYVLDTQQGHNAYMPDIYFYIEIKDDRKLG